MKNDFFVIGAGLAGSEAALTLARSGAKVCLFEQKPKNFSAVHKLSGAAELVCSNSFKSTDVNAAHGLLKEELRLLGSPLIELAYSARIPGGKSLSVDREKFSQAVTAAIGSEKNIDFRCEQTSELPENIPTLIATGPLTSQNLIEKILKLCGDDGLYFYDATSPVVELSSLDLSKFFWASRNEDSADYLNLPLDRHEYHNFRNQVLAAEKVESHLNEDLKFFEGCLPIEVLAERGEETLAYSCMKPIGFEAHLPKKAHAIIQFRREKAAGELLSMVGFQTRMKWPEQERVFRLLPGMENAVFARLGAMHRNTFINAPQHLNDHLQLKVSPTI
ncbi:MAG: Methylenetetrahydrofolate--tRNA-(uracil-5-)-methyltransferase TrmFO, partial [Bacteriovoracaceae bacterium]|nr:Methylenetetrahydrofolate--tRNA-(uracil-5-)-methyltransferase TrmFO [Bacteriovoracaceae bacterium]